MGSFWATSVNDGPKIGERNGSFFCCHLQAEITYRFVDSNICEYDEFYAFLTNWKAEIVIFFIEIHTTRINSSYIYSKKQTIGENPLQHKWFYQFQENQKQNLILPEQSRQLHDLKNT